MSEREQQELEQASSGQTNTEPVSAPENIIAEQSAQTEQSAPAGTEAASTEQAAAFPVDSGETPSVPAPEPEPEAPAVVEAFVPTDSYPRQARRKPRQKQKKKQRKVLWILLVLLGVLLLIGGLYAYNVLYNPGSFFNAIHVNQSADATPAPEAVIEQVDVTVPNASPTPVPTATPTLDPYHKMLSEADTSMMQNIVNVLVIGVDYAEERETWSGKHEYHSDVMMLLAINFDENRVDLISFPRDTYAKIPGVNGIYKLNASLNCGGGFEAEGGAGFLKTCESISWMLGGVPVDYYYAVTMPAVKELVDTVGGVDYDLEMSFTMVNRKYKKGQQHLDGQGVLDYLRVRKNVSESGDLNRVNRQKKMMVALFESMQSQNLITKIPDMVSSFDGQLFTNCTAGQTAALASFAYNLDQGNIGMYSMGGTMKNIFNWNFCITDQENRQEIIKTVYGLDVPEEKEYNMTYATYRWADMLAAQYLRTTNSFVDYCEQAIAADNLLPQYVDPNIGGGFVDPGYGMPMDGGVVYPMSASAETGFTVSNVSSVIHTPAEGEIYQQYPSYARDLFNSFTSARNQIDGLQAEAQVEAAKYLAGESNSLKSAAYALADAESTVKNQAIELAGYLGYSTGRFSWSVTYEDDADFNEVYVDFR